LAWYRFGAATTITAANAMPDFHSTATFTTLATIALAYSGLELGPILGGEIMEPRKTVPRAILIAAIMIATIYILGTTALLVALPTRQIDLIGGIPQALTAVGNRIGFPWFGSLTAVLLCLSSLGGLGAWIAGTARLPLVVGVDRYLPKPLAALHPKYGTPYVALLTQATIVTLILRATLSGSAIHEAFLILIDMTLILTFIPLLYLFAALPVLRRRGEGGNRSSILIPGGALGCWLASGLGFATTMLAIVTSLVPPEHTTDPTLFFVKVFGRSCLLIGAGMAFYLRGRKQISRRPA
jgi:amino acid transporter